jgi:hypothetical protein
MLKVLHDGIRYSVDIDPATLTGDYEVDSALAYVVSLVGGRVGAIDTDGYAQLADGTVGNNLLQMGFIINDAAGYFYENKPALASRKIPLLVGNCVVISDQIDTGDTFTPGVEVFVGTGAALGLLTTTQTGTAPRMGIALSAASAASPNLTLYVG